MRETAIKEGVVGGAFEDRIKARRRRRRRGEEGGGVRG